MNEKQAQIDQYGTDDLEPSRFNTDRAPCPLCGEPIDPVPAIDRRECPECGRDPLERTEGRK